MAKLVFGMNQSLDGYVDHMAFGPSPTLFRHFIKGNRSGGERMCSISDHVALVLGSATRTSTTPIRRGVYSMAWRPIGETLNSRSRPRRLPS